MAKHALIYTVSRLDILLTATSLASVIDHYQSAEPLDVLVMGDDIFNSDIELVRSLPERFHKPQVKVYFFNPPITRADFDDYHNERFPLVVTWRLFAPSFFPNYDRQLYLDNDTLVYGDITPMFDLCPDDKLFAAVPDFFYYSQKAVFQKPEFPELKDSQKYISSGVILFNVPLYNQKVQPQKLIDALHHNTARYPDQTLLNRLGEGQMAFLDFTYNFQKDASWLKWVKTNFPETYPDFERASHHVLIRHFVGYLLRSRPWQHLASYDQYERDFWHYEMLVRQYFVDKSQQLGYDTASRLDNAGLKGKSLRDKAFNPLLDADDDDNDDQPSD